MDDDIPNDDDDGKPRKPKRPRKKPRSPHYKANNEGGYGNPPVDHQFRGKPGPGRKTKEVTLASSLARLFSGDVTRKDGAVLSFPDAFATTLRDTILQRNVSSSKLGLELFEKYGPKPPLSPELDYRVFSPIEFGLLKCFLDRGFGLPPRKVEIGPLGPIGDSGEGIYRAEKGEDGYVYTTRIAMLEDEVTIIPNRGDDEDRG